MYMELFHVDFSNREERPSILIYTAGGHGVLFWRRRGSLIAVKMVPYTLPGSVVLVDSRVAEACFGC